MSASHQDLADWAKHGFATRAIHVGSAPDEATGAVIPPMHLSSTFKQDGVGGLRGGYEYSRSANPTRDAWQTCLAGMECGDHGFSFASGLASQDTLLRSVLTPGDHVIIPDDAYGGTFRLIDKVMLAWGVRYTPAHLSDIDAVRAAMQPHTRLIWCETPTNPLLSVADIAALAELAHGADALLAVDNTFATPYLQNPLEHGADVVSHSTTKYLGGHSDVVGGALVTRDGVTVPGQSRISGESVAERIRFHQNAMGAVSGPFDAWLTMRGAKTLAVRMDRHCENARRVAEALVADSRVGRVIYPGLDDHPDHATAARQMRDYGGMVAFEVADEATAKAVCDATRVFTLAESLGGVESLIEHPGAMTHASVAGSQLEVPSTLVRLSVGIEDGDDLVADILSALERATAS